MRIAASVTSITWLPREAVEDIPGAGFDVATATYDEPPPDVITSVDDLRQAGRFREANELRAWIEVMDGTIVACGHEGRGVAGPAEFAVTPHQVAFPAIEFPVIRPEPEIGDDCVRFIQTVGGRVGAAAPVSVPDEPYPLITAASAWTTLELIIYADGRSRGRLVAASPFPRHWVYDADGRVVEKREMTFDAWARRHGTPETPWEAPELAAAVASELERELAASVLKPGAGLKSQRLAPGEPLVEQGAPGRDIFVLLTGLLDVEVDGTTVARLGAGAIVGERAGLEDGRRTATLRAATHSCVGVISPEQVDRAKLAELSASRR